MWFSSPCGVSWEENHGTSVEDPDPDRILCKSFETRGITKMNARPKWFWHFEGNISNSAFAEMIEIS